MGAFWTLVWLGSIVFFGWKFFTRKTGGGL
ncbi:hypothetical protein ES703_57494 [subsurface metagenome]